MEVYLGLAHVNDILDFDVTEKGIEDYGNLFVIVNFLKFLISFPKHIQEVLLAVGVIEEGHAVVRKMTCTYAM